MLKITARLILYVFLLQSFCTVKCAYAEGNASISASPTVSTSIPTFAPTPSTPPVVSNTPPSLLTVQNPTTPITQATQTTPVTQATQTTQPTIIGAESAELSTLEQTMSSDVTESEKSTPQPPKFKTLQQFGYSFFRPGVDNFAPQTDIPVSPDYILGVGDSINLTIWGSIEGNYELEINRNGEIILPKVGTVKLSGSRFDTLPQLLKGQLAKVFKDFKINVTMGKIRKIKIYVVGQVKNPGDYSLSSMSTLINALSIAGGPTKNGTLRNITIRRNGSVVDTVDLYDFFLKGDKSRDIRLQSGDTIFVPSIGKSAGITGNVRRPAIYELNGEKTLNDLLALSDGIIPTGYLQRLQISRVEAHQKKSVLDVSLDPGATGGKSIESIADGIAIKDMDLVKIFQIDQTLRGYVRLDGYVLRPGDYAIKQGMKLSDILTPDNLLPEYYQFIGKITRLTPPDYHPELIFFNPSNAAAKQTVYDLELQEFDTIQIYSRWEMEEMPQVKINGEVQKPGNYRLFQKMTLRDLIYSAGNLKLTAYLNNAEVTRTIRDGIRVSNKTMTVDLTKVLQGDKEHNLLLAPFDEIFIRRIPYWAEETERYVTLSGEFLFPGTYPILKGEKLSSVIKRAGGFSDKAYPRAAKFTRISVKARQQQQMDEVISRLDEQISQQQASIATAAASAEELNSVKATLAALQTTLSKMKALKAEGRMVINILPPEELKGMPDDVELEGGDMLFVPPTPATVSVLGKVFNPTNPLLRPGETTSYYLSKSGGITSEAEASDIYVIRADGSIESRQQDFWLSSFFGGGLMGKTIEPGDTIVVPTRIEKTAWLRDIKDWTTILSQIAITAGTVLLGLR